ncbi:MAG: hypothetical protein NTY99_00470 [DPANN group archaeon]|nr:hypothetical protein [DPANN group archaeon]
MDKSTISLLDANKIDKKIANWLNVSLDANYSAIVLGEPSDRAQIVKMLKAITGHKVYDIRSAHTLIGILEDETPFKAYDRVHVNLDVDVTKRPYFDAIFSRKIRGIAESAAPDFKTLVSVLENAGVARGKLLNNFYMQIAHGGIVDKVAEVVDIEPATNELGLCTVFEYSAENKNWVYSGTSYILQKANIKYADLGNPKQ